MYFCKTVVIDSVTGGILFQIDWYISSWSKQFPSRWQVSFCRQLCLGWSWVFSSDRILFLCDFIMLLKLRKQLSLTLTLLMLNILWNLLAFGKCLSISFRKVFPRFFSTLTLYGGLNHTVFLCLTFFEGGKSCWFYLYPLAGSTSL